MPIESKDVLTSSRWAANTRIQLVNVPWDSAYRDVVAWDSAADRDQWFLDKYTSGYGWVNDHARYIRPGEPVNIPIPYSSAYKYNYLVVTNPQQPVDYEGFKKAYYYFITKTEYVSPQVTRLTLQLDVMTTYGTDISLGNMYVDSGHLGVSNKKFKDSAQSFDYDQSLMLNYLTQPEGLDIGSGYVVRDHKYYNFLESSTGQAGGAWCLVVSTADLTADPGTVDNPTLQTGTGVRVGALPSAASIYAMDCGDLPKLFEAATKYSWVTQCITAIVPFPKILLPQGTKYTLFSQGQVPLYSKMAEAEIVYANRLEFFKRFAEIWQDVIPGIVNPLKLCTYPYSVIELTCFNGGSVFIKPELWRTGVFKIQLCATPGSTRICVYPTGYNGTADTSQTYNSIDWSTGKASVSRSFMAEDYLDSALVIDGFPTFPLVNNAYMTYLASTAHGRAYNYESAGWTNAKSQAAAQLSYDQTQASLSTAAANQQLTQDLAAKSRDYSAVSAGIGVVGSALSGNIGGALSGAASGVMQYDLANSQMATSQQQFLNQQNLSANIADQNLQYAQYAANGDYRNAIAGIQATVQDAALKPPTVTGQLDGEAFNWLLGLIGFDMRYKTIGDGAAQAVAGFFARYGYKINRFIQLSGKKLADLKVMSHASYWKVQECYLDDAPANETEKDAIRGVFEKGVTLWDKPESIGHIDFLKDNEPLYNISY